MTRVPAMKSGSTLWASTMVTMENFVSRCLLRKLRLILRACLKLKCRDCVCVGARVCVCVSMCILACAYRSDTFQISTQITSDTPQPVYQNQGGNLHTSAPKPGIDFRVSFLLRALTLIIHTHTCTCTCTNLTYTSTHIQR
jgi:hypothetical protein